MSIENTLKNRRSIRLPDYDYRQAGAYFVTICSYNKNCLLGTIRGDDMILNELGTVVENAWLQIPKSRTNVILDAFVVMPNHLHGILILIEDPDIIPSGFTVPSLARNSTLQSGSLGATIGQFKSAVTKRWNTMSRRPSMSLWQRNYHEHIIRNEQSLIDIRAYILDNPARWAEDELYVK